MTTKGDIDTGKEDGRRRRVYFWLQGDTVSFIRQLTLCKQATSEAQVMLKV